MVKLHLALREFRNKLLKSQLGQGSVEYFLMLVISVSIIIGVIAQFNRGFSDFLETYFAYYQCLLEVGEIPGNTKECDIGEISAAIQKMADGKGRIGEVEGKDKKGKDNKTGDQAGDSDDKAKPVERAEGAAANGESKFLTGSNRNASRVPVSEKDDKSGKEDSTGEDGSGSGVRPRFDVKGGTETTPSATGTEKIAAEENQDKGRNKPQKIAGKLESSDESGLAKLGVEKTNIRESVVKQEDQKFTFGKFLRILVIIGVLIAILIFVGGQVLQIAKNWE